MDTVSAIQFNNVKATAKAPVLKTPYKGGIALNNVLVNGQPFEWK
jgi:hypothetical protein